MKFDISYKAKLFGLGASMMIGGLLSSCEKKCAGGCGENQKCENGKCVDIQKPQPPEPQQPVQQHDTYYYFAQNEVNEIKPTDKIKASADSTEVVNVYISPKEGRAFNLSKEEWNSYIENIFKPALNVSQKVKGRGNISADLDMNDADKQWLVQNGWTVNQGLQQHETDYEFGITWQYWPVDQIKSSADSASVVKVNLVPLDEFQYQTAKNIHNRVIKLQELCDFSSKISGNNNEIRVGDMTPEDSISLVLMKFRPVRAR